MSNDNLKKRTYALIDKWGQILKVLTQSQRQPPPTSLTNHDAARAGVRYILMTHRPSVDEVKSVIWIEEIGKWGKRTGVKFRSNTNRILADGRDYATIRIDNVPFYIDKVRTTIDRQEVWIGRDPADGIFRLHIDSSVPDGIQVKLADARFYPEDGRGTLNILAVLTEVLVTGRGNIDAQ